MSTQKNINSDYLWVRHAPVEEGSKIKIHGYHYMYNRAPNRVQRLEMVYRSMGKTFDWQLEKFRLGRKFVDRGNKRRIYRNFARFVKHPVAYLAWANARWQMAASPRASLVFFSLTLLGMAYEWRSHTNIIEQHDEILLSSGKNIEGMSGRYTGYHNQKPLRSPDPMSLWLRVPIDPNQVIINQTWKQNLRKELQLTNSQGVVF